jgi:ABC-type phosphate/phosphonate transport system substrate-binding protein
MRHRFYVCVLTWIIVSSRTTGIVYGQEKIEIGIVPSLIVDLSIGQQKFINDEFPLLVRDFTGHPGVLHKAGSPKELADNLQSGKAHFGVFQGIEFAETQATSPELQPLLLSVYRTPEIKALLVTKKDATYKSFADLREKDVALMKEGKEHIRRFAQKEAGGDPAKFFGKITTPAKSEAALDAVLLGNVQAALVDTATLDIYKEVNPGRFQKLAVIAESAVFPPSVIGYDPKKADSALVKSAKGREVMSTFKITEFMPVPTGFDQKLAAIRKAYLQ